MADQQVVQVVRVLFLLRQDPLDGDALGDQVLLVIMSIRFPRSSSFFPQAAVAT